MLYQADKQLANLPGQSFKHFDGAQTQQMRLYSSVAVDTP